MKILNVEKYNLTEEQLTKFGFLRDDVGLYLNKDILNNEFRVEIRVIDKVFEIEVFDNNFNEIYPLFSVDSAVGELVANVRNEVEIIIKEILELSDNTEAIYNEIIKYIKKKYSSTMVKPFRSNPNIKAFVTDKNKWYALILDVEYNKLNKDSSIESKVKIINLKHNTDHIPKIINERNIFPSYHMSKKHWISVVIDNNMDLNYLTQLIDISYNLVKK
mgnify:FL=1